MTYDPYQGRYTEQTAFPQHQQHQKNVQRLTTGTPQPNRQQITAAQRQEEIEARVRQNRTKGNPASLRRRAYTPANRANRDNKEGIDGEYDDVWPAQTVRSAVRFTPGQYIQGDTQWNVQQASPPGTKQYSPIPRRSSRNAVIEDAGGEEEEDFEEEEPETRLPRKRRNVHIHWFVFAGIALLLMLGGWIAFNDLGVWLQNHQDDVTYGMPRTYQTDAVVGHNDSNSNPSHFIAINLRGQIYVIELPGGDATKARGYFITSEVGGNPNPPVTVKFQDLTHSGHLDMVVTIGDPPTPLIVFLFNNGNQFAGKSH